MERGKALRRTGRLEAAHSVLNQAFEMSVADADFFASASASGDLALTMIVLGHSDEAASMLNEMHRRVIERKIRMYPVCGMYLALAELALLRLERGTTRIIDARRACHEANRKGRPFSTARPAALRLEGRLAALSRQPRRAERLWRRAAAVAEKLGAHYESSLIERERERDRHRMATENDD